MFTICSLYIHYVSTICSRYVLRWEQHTYLLSTPVITKWIFKFTICSLYVHYIFTICSLYVHYMFTICSLYVHYVSKSTCYATEYLSTVHKDLVLTWEQHSHFLSTHLLFKGWRNYLIRIKLFSTREVYEVLF